MKLLILLSLFLSSLFSNEIDLGKWNEKSFNTFLSNLSSKSKEEKSLEISNEFLQTAYVGNVLIGSKNKKEELVINFSKLDCFTFIDYVEAIKNSNDFNSFEINLIKTRYKNSKVTFENRNHFFSDWIDENGFENITSKLSPNTKKVIKYLNKKDDNSLYLDGIKIVKREIEYLESKFVDEKLLNKLQTGDYIGIYSTKIGLDATHTAMIIKKDNKTYFRHASSKKSNMKVIDELFIDYIKKTPGFFVLRKSN